MFESQIAMKHVLAAVVITALSFPTDCFAVSPMSVAKGPAASVKS